MIDNVRNIKNPYARMAIKILNIDIVDLIKHNRCSMFYETLYSVINMSESKFMNRVGIDSDFCAIYIINMANKAREKIGKDLISKDDIIIASEYYQKRKKTKIKCKDVKCKKIPINIVREIIDGYRYENTTNPNATYRKRTGRSNRWGNNGRGNNWYKQLFSTKA